MPLDVLDHQVLEVVVVNTTTGEERMTFGNPTIQKKVFELLRDIEGTISRTELDKIQVDALTAYQKERSEKEAIGPFVNNQEGSSGNPVLELFSMGS